MRNTLPLWFVLVGFSLFSGCSGSRQLLWPAGTTQEQRENASLHDPYADNDIAPPMIGGRPRDFMEPRPEAVRNDWFRNTWWGR